MTGNGDLTYNTRRNLLGAISAEEKIAYHLFHIDIDSNINCNVKLHRKSKWHSQYSTFKGNNKTYLSFLLDFSLIRWTPSIFSAYKFLFIESYMLIDFAFK